MTGFTQVFGGTVIYPSDASYLALALTADTTLAWPSNTSSSPIAASIIDVTPSGAFTITLDDARLVSPGITILFNNLGPDTITVNKADGNAVLSIGPGEQWQIYLTSNATEGGSWRTFRYGAATAQAQAAALAGSGLEADGSVLDQAYPVTELSSTPYSLTAPDRAKAFVWTGALGTLNLPTAAAAGNGWFVHVRNGGSGDLTLDPSGSETINDASTLVLQPGDSAVVVCGGAEWYTIGYGQQPVFAFDYTSIAVTTGTYTLSGSELNRIAYKFTGVLTGNVTVVVPATIQQYWVNNATTGAFTLSLRAAGSGTSTAVNQGETAILYCDGTAIISATTSSPFAGTLAISQGGTGATTAADARTNLGATGIGSSVFTAATTAAARSAIAAAASGANSDITSLSGLTTPLTVGQGGTGSATAGGARTNLGAAASGANSDITSLAPASGLVVGSATGGAQGAGTVNATGLFINGVAVGTGSGSVTSVAASGGTTGLSFTGSPITTSGTLTLSGTLGVANGGTGQTSYTDGQLLIGNSTGNTLAKSTLTAGAGINITNGSGTITIAATNTGTVTSVNASGGTTGLTFTGGAITTSGTLTLGGTLAVANGGTGASSASGARLTLGAAAAGANSDITSLSGLTTALSVPQGGTGRTSLTGNYLLRGNDGGAVNSSVIYDNGTNVGIGTASPASKLDVQGQTTTGNITVRGDGSEGGQISLNSIDNAVAAFNFDVDSGNNGRLFTTLNDLNLTLGQLTGTGGNVIFATAANERMRITNTGNVGIGTNSPGTKLQIAADSVATNPLGIVDTNASGKSWGIGPSVGTADPTIFALYDYTSSHAASYFKTGASGYWAHYTNGTERMRIDSSGNVGIGTTAPNVKLRVDYSNTSFAGGLLVANTANSGNAWGRIDVANTNTGGSLVLAQELSGQVNIINTTNMPMAFGTNNTTRMTIGNTGNVGIGTSNPEVLLDLNGSQIARGDGAGYVYFAPKTGTAPFGANYDRFEIRVNPTVQETTIGNTHGGTGSPRALAFLSGGSERMRIDTAGNVGIGTSTPGQLLTVRYDHNGTTAALIQNRNASGSPAAALQFISGAFDLTDDRYAMIASAGGANNTLQFYTSQGATPTEKMRIDSSGNVGIGTSAPSQKLQVAASTNQLSLTTGTNELIARASSTEAALYTFQAIPLVFYNNNAERMRINSSGNVGIGTASPGQALDVVGNIRASSTLLAGAIQTGYGVSTGDCAVEIGGDRTGSGNSYIDLHSTSGTDYETRIARYTGANGGLDILNTGTGNMVVGQVGAGPLVLYTNNLERMRITDTGAITSSDLADAVGYKGIPQRAITASTTLALTDMAYDIYISGTTAAQTVTVPANGSVAFPIGTVIQITNDSNQNWSVAITTDTMVWAPSGGTGTRTLAPFGQATLKKVTATRWWITGAGLT